MVHLHSGILLGRKKEGDLAICDSGMDLEGRMLTDIGQLEKGKRHMISLIWGIRRTK